MQQKWELKERWWRSNSSTQKWLIKITEGMSQQDKVPANIKFNDIGLGITGG